jgi:hypothetical protein
MGVALQSRPSPIFIRFSLPKLVRAWQCWHGLGQARALPGPSEPGMAWAVRLRSPCQAREKELRSHHQDGWSLARSGVTSKSAEVQSLARAASSPT